MCNTVDDPPTDISLIRSDEDACLDAGERYMSRGVKSYLLGKQPPLLTVRKNSAGMPWNPSPPARMAGNYEVVYYCVRMTASNQGHR